MAFEAQKLVVVPVTSPPSQKQDMGATRHSPGRYAVKEQIVRSHDSICGQATAKMIMNDPLTNQKQRRRHRGLIFEDGKNGQMLP